MEPRLTELKLLLGIGDTLQDPLLLSILTTISNRLRVRLFGHPAAVPEELRYIVIEAAVARFNRLGSEHLKSESEEGLSQTWYDTDNYFIPYATEIEVWNIAAGEEARGYTQGRAIFI